MRANTWCQKHYMLQYRRGTLQNKVLRGGTALERFNFWVDKTKTCWLWKGALDKRGYGRMLDESGWRDMAHRWSYKHFVGKIPEGLVIDHLCKKPSCVNPEHLEPVTSRENTIGRGVTNAAFINSQKTHCIHGHSLKDAYRVKDKYGYQRVCRVCRKDIARRYKERATA